MKLLNRRLGNCNSRMGMLSSLGAHSQLQRPGIRSTQVNSSVRMKKTQESSKWLFLDNLIPEIESKAPN